MSSRRTVVILNQVICVILVLCSAAVVASSAQTFTTLVDFNGTDGYKPDLMSLVQGTDGNLYGTTYYGGAHNQGTVFKMTPTGTLTTLYSFAGGSVSDGAQPAAGLVLGTDGNFYGTTWAGGASGLGTIFKITPGGALTTLHSFAGYVMNGDGSRPLAALIQATDGNLYGTTTNGGAHNFGAIFKISLAGELTTLFSFHGTDGSLPDAGLTQASDGNFYGTTQEGGANGYGTVFKITPGGSLTILHSFEYTGGDGAYPYAPVVQANDGNLYGTTEGGGATLSGTVFRVTPGGTLTILHSFCPQTGCADGANPYAPLIQGNDSNLYGTTERGGGAADGTVFKITPAGSLTTLHSFVETYGSYPYGGLVQATSGIFYGTTYAGGGGTGGGTVFSLSGGEITPQENPGSGNPSELQMAACQSCGGDPVNTAFGTFSESLSDFSVSGRGLALLLRHTYNSIFAAVNGPLGFGWTHSYNMQLTQSSAGVVAITQENGSQVVFTPSGNTYTAPARVIATLVKNSDGTFLFTCRAEQFFTFSSTGQLLSEHDRNGYTTTLTYNASGQLATASDAAARTINFTYSGSHLVSVTDPLGRKVSFAYDASGNLTSVTDVAGGQTKFTYSSGHLLLSMTNPLGGKVTNTYDSSQRVISQTDPLGRTTSFSYAAGVTSVTDAKGNIVQDHYNSLNERTSVTLGYGTTSAATWSFAYDPDTAALTSVTNPNGHTTTTTYDASANPLQSADPLGRITNRTWDSMNDLTSVTDPLGVTTTLTYDANGNLLTRSTPLTGTSLVQTYTYQYGDSTHPGDVTGIVDPDGKTTKFAYDADGDLSSSTDPLLHVTKFAYNTIGWMTSLTDALGKITSYTYNSFGDPEVTTDPLGHKVTRVYDANRNLISITDPNGNVTGFTYDADNERIKTTRADGTILQTTHNNDGTISQSLDGAGNATAYSYDALARPVSLTDPLGRVTHYSYDGTGNLLSLTDAAGQVTSGSYDAANELISIAYSDGKTPGVSFSYDADGQRVSMADGTGTSSWKYDSLHRVVSSNNGAGAKVSYAYDLKGQLKKITYPGGTHTVTRVFDAAGRLTSITDWLTRKTTFAYDADNNLITEILPSTTAMVAKFAYDAGSRLTGITDAKSGVTFASFAYTRDAAGLLTASSETGVPSPGTDTFGYTLLNQLANANAASYTYSAADNITGIITPAQFQLTYDKADELTSLAVGTQTTSFSYDSRGNRLSRVPPSGPALSYAYDQANRLVSFGSRATYRYDGDGLRASKMISGVTEAFSWQRSGNLPLLLVDGTTSYVYGPDGLPVEQVSSSGTTLFYLHDQLGSTRLLATSAGAVQTSYTYDAYGNLVAQTGTAANPFGYAGEFLDPESGLVFLRARYYDPSTAQFLARDPLTSMAPTFHPYEYADHNPLDERDSLGLDPTLGDLSPFIYRIKLEEYETLEQIEQSKELFTAGTVAAIPLVGLSFEGCADIALVERGGLFGTRLGGNTPFFNSNNFLRVGWSYISKSKEYVFRVGGDWIPKWINGGHINLWPPAWWLGPPGP